MFAAALGRAIRVARGDAGNPGTLTAQGDTRAKPSAQLAIFGGHSRGAEPWKAPSHCTPPATDANGPAPVSGLSMRGRWRLDFLGNKTQAARSKLWPRKGEEGKQDQGTSGPQKQSNATVSRLWEARICYRDNAAAPFVQLRDVPVGRCHFEDVATRAGAE